MASRIIHLAVTEELIKQFDFSNVERLRLGTILPDAALNKENSVKSHFKMTIGDAGERSYNLTAYREEFYTLMKTDDLYLGYYLHLIQDLLYRHFVYDKYNWNPHIEGNVDRLHDDYRQVNECVIKRYGLKKDSITLPEDFNEEKINRAAAFDAAAYMKEYESDFEPVKYKERFFFTDNMADEYIHWAAELCLKELEAFRNGKVYFDEYEWSWGK